MPGTLDVKRVTIPYQWSSLVNKCDPGIELLLLFGCAVSYQSIDIQYLPIYKYKTDTKPKLS